MISNLPILSRRELWEHRSLYMTPMVVGGLIVLAVTIFLITAGLLKGIGFERLVQGLTATGEVGSATGFGVLIMAPAVVLSIALSVTVFFYSLDALYAERKDRSILFWRSLPLTDTETVVSKLVTAVVVAPLITFAVLCATQLAILVVSTVVIWVGGGDASELVWGPVPVLQIIGLSLYTLVASSLWSLPFIAWFLLCSAFVKKGPFMWAVLPFFLVPLLERLAFRSDYFVDIVWGHIGEFYSVAFTSGNISAFSWDDDGPKVPTETLNPAGLIDFGGLLGSIDLWVGVLIAIGLTATTIYVRRYRTEADS